MDKDWVITMAEEIEVLKENNTSILVDKPPNAT